MFIKLRKAQLKLSTFNTPNNFRVASKTYLTTNLLTFIVDVVILV